MTRAVRWFALALALAVLAILPASAAASRQEMQASGAVTATGNSAAFSLNTGTNLVVGVDVTAISGTSPFLDLWLQVSDDGGTTWYDYPADFTLATASTSATPGTSAANARDIVDHITTGATGQYVGTYKSIASDKIRLRWVISGTSPSFTFSASFVAK